MATKHMVQDTKSLKLHQTCQRSSCPYLNYHRCALSSLTSLMPLTIHHYHLHREHANLMGTGRRLILIYLILSEKYYLLTLCLDNTIRNFPNFIKLTVSLMFECLFTPNHLSPTAVKNTKAYHWISKQR